MREVERKQRNKRLETSKEGRWRETERCRKIERDTEIKTQTARERRQTLRTSGQSAPFYPAPWQLANAQSIAQTCFLEIEKLFA